MIRQEGEVRPNTEHIRLMAGLRVLQLELTVRAVDAVAFGDQPGSALRGALYGTLAAKFCGVGYDEATPEHRSICPVCRLLAAEDDKAGRGRNLPRPLAIQPPLGATYYPSGATFRFGISLIGWAESALLYVLRAVEALGHSGVGRGRSRLQVLAVKEVSPLESIEHSLLEGRMVRQPQIAVTVATVEDALARRPLSNRVCLELLTPMRLTSEGRLVKKLNALVLMQRLIERCQNLTEHYSVPVPAIPPVTREEWLRLYRAVSDAAQTVTVAADDTYWVEARSGSRRQQRYTEIGGLVGSVVFEGELALLLPWLLWGQSLHVGKDAVKGNGWFRVQDATPVSVHRQAGE